MTLLILCLLLCLAAGGGLFVNYLLLTDAATGFLLQGDALLYYGMLAVLVLVLAVASLRFGAQSKTQRVLTSRGLVLTFSVTAILFFAAAVLVFLDTFFAFGAGQRLPFFSLTSADLAGFILPVFFVLGGVWALFCAMGYAAGKPQQMGSFGAGFGMTIGMFLFCIKRFVASPTSILRIMPTLDILSALAVLLLCCAMLRAVYLPRGASEEKHLFLFGLLAFLFGTCFTGAKLAYLAVTGSLSLTAGADLPLVGLGLVGLAVALHAVHTDRRRPARYTYKRRAN